MQGILGRNRRNLRGPFHTIPLYSTPFQFIPPEICSVN